MHKTILANVTSDEVRMALLEDGQLAEVSFERGNAGRVVGNIYKGRIETILPGMQAAFINVGLEKNAFLYIGDIMPERGGVMDETLTAGQDILVQLVKDPMGTKGARATTHISLPGRYAVLMPTVDCIGISRRIGNEKERQRLKELAEKVRPAGMGLIIRTVAEGKNEEELKKDVLYLSHLWTNLITQAKTVAAPRTVYQDVDLLLRIVRDYLDDDVTAFYIDDRAAYQKVREILQESPDMAARVKMYRGRNDIFERYSVEQEIEKIGKKQVRLKNGGYLVIDHTEALTVIDVNTGKFVGNTNLADTVFRTNMEAAQEICRQLRLRDIGGIIVCDFIDMDTTEHQQAVLAKLNEEFKKDHTKTNVLGITHLGLVEMTRKKARQGVESMLYDPCPYCEGRGQVLSPASVAIKIKRLLRKTAREKKTSGILCVQASPEVVKILEQGGQLEAFCREVGRKVEVTAVPELQCEKFTVTSEAEKKETPAPAPEKVSTKTPEKNASPRAADKTNGRRRLSSGRKTAKGSPKAPSSEAVRKETEKDHTAKPVWHKRSARTRRTDKKNPSAAAAALVPVPVQPVAAAVKSPEK